MSPIQIAALIFAVAMSYVTYVGYRRGNFRVTGLALWEAIWIGLAAVSLFPQVFQGIVRPLHLARLMDLVVVVGMLVLGGITYRNYSIVQRLQDQLERFVREQALGAATRPSGAEPDPKR